MLDKYPNIITNNERLVETCFVIEKLKNLYNQTPALSVLDVGGVPSEYFYNYPIYKNVANMPGIDYKISDFRSGNIQDNSGFRMSLPVAYAGDFVSMNIPEKFDAIIFLSSLEHFAQCTESDGVFRDGEDRKGFEKALSLLNPSGKIILTIPFGVPKFESYYQTYDLDLVNSLVAGSDMLEYYTYELIDDVWCIGDPETLGQSSSFGIGCFLLEGPSGLSENEKKTL